MGRIITLDLKGELSPFPLIAVTKKFNDVERELKSGSVVIEVIVDHPPASKSIPSEAIKRGYNVKLKKVGKYEWRITVKIKKDRKSLSKGTGVLNG